MTDLRVADNSHDNVVTVTGGTPYFHHGPVYLQNFPTPPAAASQRPLLRRCPPPSANFTPRPSIYERMYSCIFESTDRMHIFVLHGPGGAGKSELAAKFAYEYYYKSNRRRFSQVYFVDASSTEAIELSLENIALASGIGSTAPNALFWLENQDGDAANWLMIFDNADDPSIDLGQHFPSCAHGNVIITTRNFEVKKYGTGPYAGSLVTDMSPTEAVHVLLKNSHIQAEVGSLVYETAERLAKELGYFALAVSQAGAYICTSGCGLDGYLKLYLSQKAELMNMQEATVQSSVKHQHKSVFYTWMISYQKLTLKPKQFLEICANLHYKSIPVLLIQRMATCIVNFVPLTPFSKQEEAAFQSAMAFAKLFLDTENKKWNSVAFLEIIAQLQSFSLVSFDSAQQICTIYPFIHQWSGNLPLTLVEASAAVLIMMCSTVSDTGQLEEFRFQRSLLPHIQHLLPRLDNVHGVCSGTLAMIYLDNGKYCYNAPCFPFHHLYSNC